MKNNVQLLLNNLLILLLKTKLAIKLYVADGARDFGAISDSNDVGTYLLNFSEMSFSNEAAKTICEA